ncbi:MAG: 16S rRNA (cytidine(1402)-2'-O)-methyltransferase [Bacillota bacterium]
MKAKCYLVATPIGNLKDITLRAIETLKFVDIIACEDTRHTLRLLNHYEIKKPLISYHEHKEKEGALQILDLISNGKNVALVSDAGMPCISDPGALLVQKLRENGVDLTVIPGASALTSAVSLSGLEGVFTFLGFLKGKRKQIDDTLIQYKNINTALVIYCAPHDLQKTLDILHKNLGRRGVSLIKEITKIYEGVTYGYLGEISIDAPKGEYVIIVYPPDIIEKTEDIDIEKELKELLEKGMSKRDASSYLSEKYSLSKNKVYSISLNI